MFTGIIIGQGEIRSLKLNNSELRLGILALFSLPDIVIGESISVNGVCLTVESGSKNFFCAYASKETLNKSNLGTLRIGSHVNLERALAVGERLGGHIVSGHTDGIATVIAVERTGESRKLRFSTDYAYSPEIIAKGSVAINGVSLTVNDCGYDFLEVNVIPATWESTTLCELRVGDRVNLETDILGKYVRHILSSGMPKNGIPGKNKKNELNFEMLRENGFI